MAKHAWDEYNHECESCWNSYDAKPQGDPCYKHRTNPDNPALLPLEVYQRLPGRLTPRDLTLELLAWRDSYVRISQIPAEPLSTRQVLLDVGVRLRRLLDDVLVTEVVEVLA